jgi:esterase/lipase
MTKERLPLLVLHGALGSAMQMQPLVDVLKKKFEIFTLNFSGHGGLPLPTGKLSIDLFVQEVRQFLDKNQIEQINIFGYSMGGYIALKLAVEDKRVNKIFTLGTKFHWTPQSAEHEVLMLDPDKIEEKVPAFASILKERHAPTDWKELMNKTVEMMLELGRNPSLTENILNKITTPVTITIGDQDNMVTIEESEWAVKALPNGELKIFKGFKHPIEQVDLEELVQSIHQMD